MSRIFWWATNHDFIAERSPCEFQESSRDRHFIEVPGFHYNGKATSTRAVLKQNLSIKSQKTLFGGPSNLNCPFGVLLCLTIWTVAKMFEACIDQNLELEGKKAGNI